jgi:NADH-quinone oxidoreductase subunit L
VSAAVLLLVGRRGDAWGHLLGTAAPVASFLLGVVLFVQMLGAGESNAAVGQTLWTWFEVEGLRADFGILLDELSILFVLLITGVGSLIHIYSIGYMKHDERRRRFFGYLNLFIAAMLALVLADNYLGLFLGWEGVGLASYLLIGFWLHKDSAAVAAKKAFLVNRVGDMGMVLAIALMFATFHSVSFAGVADGIGNASDSTQTVLGLLLLLGACGKSAQVPLQTWLLDAMEGPTPVSALIHAATMVTAGRLPGRAFRLRLRDQRGGLDRGRPRRPGDAAGRRDHRMRQGRHQEGARRVHDEPDRLHDAGRRSRPGRLRFAIFHLITHGFFKANMFLGAGRSCTAWTTRSTCAATAACARSCRSRSSRSAWAISRSSASLGCPASGARTRSSRPRSARTW